MALVVVVIFFTALYVLGTYSEPFRVSLNFIDHDRTVSEELGQLRSKRLSILGGYSVRYQGPSGQAEYAISVRGEKGRGVVYLKLEKDVGQWTVLQARLVHAGKTISLTDK